MRRTLLALVVLLAIMLGAGAAGTPVNGDQSVAATTAGINLSTTSPHTVRPVSIPLESTRGVTELARFITLLLAAGMVVAYALHPDRDRSVLRWERRATRGPPPVIA